MSADTTAAEPSFPRDSLNGVNRPALLATIDVVRNQPHLAGFQFRAKCKWMNGTHTQTVLRDFSGAGGEHEHQTAHIVEADHPAVICGGDRGPTPIEYVLHALAACLIESFVNLASARGVALTAVDCAAEGDIDLRGVLGLPGASRTGLDNVRVAFSIHGDAPPAQLRAMLQEASARSAVLDMLTNGAPISVEMACRRG